jgi:hypothetical protein
MDNVQKHNICTNDMHFDIYEEKLVLLLESMWSDGYENISDDKAY